MDHHVASQTYEDVYYLPPHEWLPSLSLGYREALADLIWSRALIYFGEEVVHRGTVRHIFDYTESMLTLDPEFRAAYRWIATAALYGDTDLTPEEVRRAVDVMERGLERFPDDGQLAWDIGATLAFELPPLLDDLDEKAAARRDAAPYLMLAVRLGAAPEWVTLTNAAMLSRLGEADAAARHLEEMYAVTRDEATRQRIAEAIAELRSRTHAEAFVEMTREEEERRLREMPYAPLDLFGLIVGEPRPWQEIYQKGFASTLDEPLPIAE